MTVAPAIDQDKLQQFLGKFVADLGAAMHAPTVILGDRLGWYRALAQAPATSTELAKRTGADERYLREWLRAQAAAGYADYDAAADRFSMSPEQAFALADPDGLSAPGAFLITASINKDLDGIEHAYRTGSGYGWHEHDTCLFEGTERFFRPNYNMNLITSWIPALEGVEAKLQKGARVADVGCGHGASTILMAKAYPHSTFTGFDYHEGSIQKAREIAAQAGVSDRVTFEVASAKDYPGTYDFVTFFDCLHDMGDPTGASAHVKRSLAPGGTWLIVEPFANDNVKDNLNPIGKLFYSASSTLCVPCSMAQETRAALGAQAGEKQLREAVTNGGFTKFRRATETPFNLVFEAQA